MTDYWIVQVSYAKNYWHDFWKFIEDGKEYLNTYKNPHHFKNEQECIECIKHLKTIDPSPNYEYRTCHYTILKEYKNY